MPVPNCVICNQLTETPDPQDLADGEYCPVCYRPVCHRHLMTVRFIWKQTKQRDSALVCRDCKTAYHHRYWDTARREWIS